MTGVCGDYDLKSALNNPRGGQRVLKAVSVFAFLAAHRRELFPDAMFADLFPTGRGRPSVTADVMAAVITQALHRFSDAEDR